MWFSGNALFPAKVVITGILVNSENSISSSVASEYKIPWPALIIGFFAFKTAVTNSLTSSLLAEDNKGLIGVYEKSLSGNSSWATSVGISNNTGPGFPFFSWLNALRISSGILDTLFTCPDHFVIPVYCWEAENAGEIPTLSEGGPPGNIRIGTESEKACATPLKAFSAPGPCWLTKTPIFLPLLILENPSAIFTPALSCLQIIGLIPSLAAWSINVFAGKQDIKSTPSAFNIFAITLLPCITTPLKYLIINLKNA